jgi:gluconate 2-dehydrogenase gamma chain
LWELGGRAGVKPGLLTTALSKEDGGTAGRDQQGRNQDQKDREVNMAEERRAGPGRAAFFDAHQRQTVEAAMARIIPTDDQPGAREAGTVEFLDRYLSGLGYVYAQPDGSGFEKLEGKRAQAWQQRIDIVRDKYVKGILELDGRSREQFGSEFVELTPEQQDHVLADMERQGRNVQTLDESTATAGFAPPPEPALQQTSHETQLEFFPLLALHTRQGFYADPIYGGNRDRVGWQLIGFDGPASLAETHSGRYTTRPYFADTGGTSSKGDSNGAQG